LRSMLTFDESLSGRIPRQYEWLSLSQLCVFTQPPPRCRHSSLYQAVVQLCDGMETGTRAQCPLMGGRRLPRADTKAGFHLFTGNCNRVTRPSALSVARHRRYRASPLLTTIRETCMIKKKRFCNWI
jgi:hypothetical protein